MKRIQLHRKKYMMNGYDKGEEYVLLCCLCSFHDVSFDLFGQVHTQPHSHTHTHTHSQTEK